MSDGAWIEDPSGIPPIMWVNLDRYRDRRDESERDAGGGTPFSGVHRTQRQAQHDRVKEARGGVGTPSTSPEDSPLESSPPVARTHTLERARPDQTPPARAPERGHGVTSSPDDALPPTPARLRSLARRYIDDPGLSRLDARSLAALAMLAGGAQARQLASLSAEEGKALAGRTSWGRAAWGRWEALRGDQSGDSPLPATSYDWGNVLRVLSNLGKREGVDVRVSSVLRAHGHAPGRPGRRKLSAAS